MNVQQKNKKKGFTIIEVVLVLAIAGLIFLMVFIALPALQRGQRDQQRKNDLSRAQTAVNSYKSNNRGALPATNSLAWNTTIRDKYLKVNGDTFADPSGADYNFNVGGSVPDTFDSTKPDVYVTIGSSCDGEKLVSGQGSNKAAMQMKLEGGGIACVNG